MKEGEAKFVTVNGLSKKTFKWDVPSDLGFLAANHKKDFIGLGRWNDTSKAKGTLFWCIASYDYHTNHANLLYLEGEAIKEIKKTKM